MIEINLSPNQKVELVGDHGRPERVHVFDENSVLAVKAASAARRPLLLRGEPGVGKTQLAEAVAVTLGRPLVSRVLNSRVESQDLLWEFDAVMRLAEAQMMSHMPDVGDNWREHLAVRQFIRPGPIWFALDWKGACQQASVTNTALPDSGFDECYDGGCVLLIDEIDKAETDVPNGLLEALGSSEFTPPGFSDSVSVTSDAPIVIITTNEERTLPDAFIRRCLVHEMRLPEGDELKQQLIDRGRAHFGTRPDERLLDRAAILLLEDRTLLSHRI